MEVWFPIQATSRKRWQTVRKSIDSVYKYFGFWYVAHTNLAVVNYSLFAYYRLTGQIAVHILHLFFWDVSINLAGTQKFRCWHFAGTNV